MIEKPKKERRLLKALGRVGEILLQEVLIKVGSSLIKRIGGKKTLPSILFLFLSISLFAQFPSTGNKQRLGFQTSADGLAWRGSISDTSTIQPVSNQNAWVILDTVNLKIYSFDFTSNVWNALPQGTNIDTTSLSNRINLKLNLSDTASMLLPYLRDADTMTLSNRINLKLNISDTSAFARDNQISGTSGQVAYFNSSSSVVSDTALRWSAANKSLGINMTSVPSGANLIIKNSQEPVRSTFLAQQTFGADTTNWTRGAGWTFNGTLAVATAATGDLTYTTLPDTIISGRAYEITYTVTGYSAGTLTVRIGNGSLSLPTHNATANVILLLPTSATGGFRFTTSSFTGNLDNITVVEISNRSPILFAGQDDGSTTLYSSLRMPNSTTFAFGEGASYTTGVSNVANGVNALFSNTTGSNNIANGSFGLRSNTTGVGNVANGADALLSNTTGGNNVANGVSALRSNTTGSNNVANGPSALFSNTTGGNNVANGVNALFSNTTGSSNVANGPSALFSNTTGGSNVANGAGALASNTTGGSNVANGPSALRSNTTGSNNVANGSSALYNTTVGDTLTGSNNIAIGTNAADNIRFAAAGNVAIGNAVDLPIQNGSNQGVYQNTLFFTGASGTGTTIAAGSRAGIKTNAPNRDLEVAGEVRITDLTTDAPTRIVGADDDGDLGQVTLGAGLNLASSSLLVDTNLLVTRFDTSAMLLPYLRKVDTSNMLLPYFRDADTSLLNLTSRFAAKLNISDTLNMLTPYLRKADTTNMLLPYFRDADTISLNLTSRFNTKVNLSDTLNMLAPYLRKADTTNMLLPYFRDADTTSLNLTSRFAAKLNISDTLNMLTPYLRKADTTLMLLPYFRDADTISLNLTSRFNTKVNLSDTLNMLAPYLRKADTTNMLLPYFRDADTTSLNLTSRFGAKLNISDTLNMLTPYLRKADTTNMLLPYFRDADTTSLNLTSRFAAKQNALNGTGFVKASGTNITYDNSTYLRTGLADSTYLKLTGGTLTGALNGTTGTFASGITAGNISPVGSPIINAGITGTETNVHFYSGLGTENNITTLRLTNNNGGFFQNGLFLKSQMLRGLDEYNAYLGIMNTNFLTFTPNSRIGVLQGSPSYTFDVNGTLGVTGATTLGSTLAVTGATTLSNQVNLGYSGSNLFTGSGIITDPGNITGIKLYDGGLGNMTIFNKSTSTSFGSIIFSTGNLSGLPFERMRISHEGNININNNLSVGGTLGVTGATTLSGALTVNNATVLNEDSDDFDTRIESDGNANMLFVDASEDRVGIGYASPTKTLDVNGEVRIGTVSATPTSLLGKDGSNVVGEVTTVAQTGLMTRGETTATTGTPSAVFTVTHGLGSNPTSIIVTGTGASGAQKLIYEVYAKNSTTFSVQVWTYLGMEAAGISTTIYWLAIK
jgi:hypothetical protein